MSKLPTSLLTYTIHTTNCTAPDAHFYDEINSEAKTLENKTLLKKDAELINKNK